MMIPLWLTILAWTVTGVGLLCAGMILADIYLGGYRQSMASWEAVWPITAFDTGMGITMLIVAFALGYAPTTTAFWFVMWGGLLLGFMTAYPMVRWLLNRGITAPAEAR